jgi:hypothetical protein
MRQYRDTVVEELPKTTKYLNQASWCPCRNSNRAPTEQYPKSAVSLTALVDRIKLKTCSAKNTRSPFMI